MLAGRYQLVEILGSGGFGETYIAADLQRPGQPLCVVKQLRPATNDLKLFRLSQRLFKREAEILERLGSHDQIPQLLAYFEEAQEFYLVEEFIDGHPLRQELLLGQSMPEPKIVEMLTEILLILDFIHACGVIHRDIKPSNIIRRRTDQKLVLIDFGAVKETQAHVVDDHTQLQTVGIGTKGYMPSEQSAGSPRFSSDIYALGVTGIQALTGYPPDRLEEDEATGELIWKTKASPSAELEAILTGMTQYSFRDRYQSARAVLHDLEVLLHRYGLSDLLDAKQNLGSVVEHHVSSLLNHISFSEMDDDDDLDNAADSTLIWASSMQSDPPSDDDA
jgi:serine/threonine protein kinase